jgi:hypothetical protein
LLNFLQEVKSFLFCYIMAAHSIRLAAEELEDWSWAADNLLPANSSWAANLWQANCGLPAHSSGRAWAAAVAS